jgi:hypothetical protein
MMNICRKLKSLEDKIDSISGTITEEERRKIDSIVEGAEPNNPLTQLYMGSVPTYDDLPETGLKVGMEYDVLDTGFNYIWNGESWDNTSSDIDIKETTEDMVDTLFNN